MQKKRILLVDDEEGFAEMIKMNLEQAGNYEVRVETKGSRALASIREFRPHLVFLDVVMPDLDGNEIAYRVKTDEDLRNIPVVFLTAIVQESELASRKGEIGGHRFLAKPVTVEKLIDCIERYAIFPDE
ncbi:MAG: response regulator [Candidatus Omnitrophica bacterium]|nr:response regulator [Candidatus Omnitrophota bacterium]MBD3268735.1 response regulator [Candidatus Omnitrophota bacterium]